MPAADLTQASYRDSSGGGQMVVTNCLAHTSDEPHLLHTPACVHVNVSTLVPSPVLHAACLAACPVLGVLPPEGQGPAQCSRGERGRNGSASANQGVNHRDDLPSDACSLCVAPQGQHRDMFGTVSVLDKIQQTNRYYFTATHTSSSFATSKKSLLSLNRFMAETTPDGSSCSPVCVRGR